MQWFYAKDGHRLGPVEDAELRGLFRKGVLPSDTLVWSPALADWQPWHAVGTLIDPGAPPAPMQESTLCVECARPFSAAELLQYGEYAVCGGCKPVFLRRLRQGTLQNLGVQYGGFGARLLAKAIDWVVLGGLQIIFQAFTLSLQSVQDPLTASLISMLMGAIGVLMMIAYNGYFVGRFGATPGKMACGLEVITAGGEKPGYGRAFGRSAAEIVSGLVMYLGFVMAAFDQQNRTLHDFICDTRVIKN